MNRLEKTIAPSALVKCDCKNTYQDQKYGKDKRVANKTLKPPGYRCTVCGKVHDR